MADSIYLLNQTKPNKNMTHTHTNSPWHLGNRAGNPAIYGKDGTEIAEILQGLTPEWRENARLIAAAPEMLAALQLIYANAGESPEWIRARIGSTIAKAEGNA
jgi:hypothetical protein